MADLETFVNQTIKPLRRDLSDDDFLKYSRAALIIDQEGESQDVMMGIVMELLDCYDKPVQTSESFKFQALLEEKDPFFPSQIFPQKRSNTFSEAIARGFIQLKPSQEDYEKIKLSAELLYAAFESFETVLPGLISKSNLAGTKKALAEIKQEIAQIKDASPEEIMTYVFNNRRIGESICKYIPMWETNVWQLEQSPQEFQKVQVAYYKLRAFCRESDYEMGVPQKLKQKQFIHRVEIFDEELESRGTLLITDTPEELEALNRRKGGLEERDILYRGPVDQVSDTIAKLQEKNLVICDPTITGPKQYQEWCQKNK